MLEEIFKMQQELEDKVLAVPENASRYGDTPESKTNKICTAIIHEAVELQRHTDFKWWKKYKGFNDAEAKEELIDIFHFVVQGALALDITPAEVFEEYKRKMLINHNRVDTGY